jgi:release factor glutamine methyltransferase
VSTAQTLFRFLTAGLSAAYDPSEAQAIAYRLLNHFPRLSRTDVLLDKPLADEQPDWPTLLARLKAHEPVQYVLGEEDFYGRTFVVTPATLIPRPETEELVSLVVKEAKHENFQFRAADRSILNSQFSILDIGTGSGCIAVTLALELPDANVTAWDISPEALAVARHNAERLGANVRFEQRDVLNFQFSILNSQFSILVSNPPYVARAEADRMHPNVLNHEPHLALFVPDDDPLVFYRAIADLGLRALVPGGLVFLEINAQFGAETAAVFSERGYASARVLQDLSGKNRFVRAVR